MYRRLVILAMMALVLVSCSKQESVGDVEVQMCASIIPEMTVIVKGGESQEEPVIANHAILQAWRDGVMAAEVETSIEPGTKEVSFSGIKLAGGAEYLIYIWVDCAGYYNTEDLRMVSVKQEKPYDGRSPQFDAFYSCTLVTCRQNDEVHSVTLKRPFAKLCFSAQVQKQLNVKYSAPTTLNLIDGQVSGVRDVEYTVQPGGTSVEAFDYVFAKDGIAQMNYTFKLGEEEAKTTSVPVARNTKTNIIYNN